MGRKMTILAMKVAIDGDTVVLGKGHATVDGNADQGEADVFVEPSSGVGPTTMTQTAKLTASDVRGRCLFRYLGRC